MKNIWTLDEILGTTNKDEIKAIVNKDFEKSLKNFKDLF